MAWALIWNPQQYAWVKQGFADDHRKFLTKGFLESAWSCGWIHSQGESGPVPGGRFFAFRVGKVSPGLVGAGHFLTRPHRKYGEYKGAPMARIRFDYLADVRSADTFISRASLRLLTGDTVRYQASGMPIPADVAARLELVLGLIRSSATVAA